LDIIQNFNIAVLVNGELIYDRKVIAKNYLKFWFGIDLISTIPYELIVNYLNNIS
jgi:hyperpolarization activated cyclic nucleotide-gated potassium channel 2